MIEWNSNGRAMLRDYDREAVEDSDVELEVMTGDDDVFLEPVGLGGAIVVRQDGNIWLHRDGGVWLIGAASLTRLRPRDDSALR